MMIMTVAAMALAFFVGPILRAYHKGGFIFISPQLVGASWLGACPVSASLPFACATDRLLRSLHSQTTTGLWAVSTATAFTGRDPGSVFLSL